MISLVQKKKVYLVYFGCQLGRQTMVVHVKQWPYTGLLPKTGA